MGRDIQTKSNRIEETSSCSLNRLHNLPEPTLPQLLSLDSSHENLERRVTAAASLLGVDLQDIDAIDSTVSRARAEFVLRWILNKLKTAEGRKAFLQTHTAWALIPRLLRIIPAGPVARLLQAHQSVSSLGALLADAIAAFQTGNQAPRKSGRPSKKRKRGDKAASPPPVAISHADLKSLAIGGTSFLSASIGIARSNGSGADAAGRQHVAASLRIPAAQAAVVLDAWLKILRCLSEAPISASEARSVLAGHEAILYVWNHCAREQDDNTGASATVFSAHALLSVATLLAGQDFRDESGNSHENLNKRVLLSVEQLLAKHILIPARNAFDSVKTSRRGTFEKAQSALMQYLEPVWKAITASIEGDRYQAKQVIDTLPKILDLAIRLAPRTGPTQEAAQQSWLEAVFATLSETAKEPIPHQGLDGTLNDHELSPLCALLKVLEKNDVKFSNEFLELVLLGYTGLEGVRDDAYPVRYDVVAALLELNATVFLKSKGAVDQLAEGQQPRYVDALMASLSHVTWASDVPNEAVINEEGLWNLSTRFGVESLIMPLLKAYASWRKLPVFVSLWFWEARRKWKVIGTPEGHDLPWLSIKLLHELRSHLEQDLQVFKVNELIIEFMLPVRQLADDVINSGLPNSEWNKIASIAPASAALVILEALLYSVGKEETLRQNLLAWRGMKDLLSRFMKTELRHFTAASKVWSLYARVYTLSRWVDGKTAWLEWQKALLDGQDPALEIAERLASSWPSAASSGADEAYRFAQTVCCLENDEATETRAKSLLWEINKSFLSSFGTSDMPFAETADRLYATLSAFVQYPRAWAEMQDWAEDSRRAFFRRLCLETAIGYSYSQSDQVLHGRQREGLEPIFDALLETLSDVTTNGALVEDVILALLDCSNDRVEEPGCLKWAASKLLEIPSSIIPRRLREMVIDSIIGQGIANLSSAPLDSELLFQYISLANRLLQETSCATAEVCLDAKIVFALARRLDGWHQDQKLQDGVDVMEAIGSFMGAVLKQAVNDATEERKASFSAGFNKKLTSVLKNTSIANEPALTSLASRWIMLNPDSDTEGHEGKLLRRFESNVMDAVDLALEKLPENPRESTASTYIFLSFNGLLAAFKRQGQCPTGITSFLQSLQKQKNRKKFHKALDGAQTGGYSALATQLRRFGALTGLIEIVTLAAGDSSYSIREHCVSLRSVVVAAAERKLDEKLKLLHDLLSSSTGEQLKIANAILRSLHPDDISAVRLHPDITVRLCSLLRSPADITQFGAATSCLSTLLRSKPWLPTQNSIDTLLATLTTLSSATGPCLPPAHASFIYTRLCHLCTAIISLHRRKLGGRMHLLTPLLQNLLTCLFTAHRYSTSPMAQRAPWLGATASLGTEEAAGYSRILTTLTQPSASSAAPSRRGFHLSALTDETKTARRYAGEYVPYVLLHYCTLQLHGKMEPEAAEKLRLGIWSLMEVVDIEGMRGMNAGMGRDERGIWGQVYGEWMRIGKGRSG